MQNRPEDVKNLQETAKRKLTTTMIYCLAEIEECFGHTWGYGKPEEELSDEELDNKHRWNNLRANILDMGHRQLGGLLKEISLHNIEKKANESIHIVFGQAAKFGPGSKSRVYTDDFIPDDIGNRRDS